jgi:hypothetical protein
MIRLTINWRYTQGSKHLATYYNDDRNCNQDKCAPTQSIMKALEKKTLGDMFMM